MNTTYTVAERYFDRFAGMNIYRGCTITLRPSSRTVAWGGKNGEPLTNDLHSPTDEDFSFVRGEYQKLATDGTLAIVAPAKKVDAPKSEPAKDEPAKQDQPTPPTDKTDPGKTDGKKK